MEGKASLTQCYYTAAALQLSGITVAVLLSTCHQRTKHQLATESEGELLDTVCVASTKIRHTNVTHHSVACA